LPADDLLRKVIKPLAGKSGFFTSAYQLDSKESHTTGNIPYTMRNGIPAIV
jgi:hypothetical protein